MWTLIAIRHLLNLICVTCANVNFHLMTKAVLVVILAFCLSFSVQFAIPTSTIYIDIATGIRKIRTKK